MKILNLHGYGAQPHNGFFYALAEYHAGEILLPAIAYEREAPTDILGKLLALCRTEKPDVVTGSSMGGFFAALLSCETGTRAVLVNPCMFPQITLPRIGMRNPAFVRQYMQLSAQLVTLENAYAIIGGKDELITYHDFTQFLLPPGHSIIAPEGGHASATMPLADIFETYGEILFGMK